MDQPEIVMEILKFSLSLNDREFWKRIRIALYADEMRQIKEWDKANDPFGPFIYAIRGLPIHIEAEPLKPIYVMESK